MEWYASQGAKVCIPFGHSPDYDFIADFGDELLRVQVKTSTRMQDGRYVVQTCTRGGNQSWSGVTKRLDARRFDSLFVWSAMAGAGASPPAMSTTVAAS